MKQLLTILCLVLLVSCEQHPESYFMCNGYKEIDWLLDISNSYNETNSLVVNTNNKTLNFSGYPESSYKETTGTHIFSTLLQLPRTSYVYTLSFDKLTGEVK